MKPSYTFLEHTADVLFQAEAPTLPELFEQCALAVEDTQVDVKTVEPLQEVTITGKNNTIERLLFDFIDDLIFYKDADLLVFSKFDIEIEEKYQEFYLTCKAYGEQVDHTKHDPKVDVKAVTLHQFKFEKTKDGYKAFVILDI